MTTWFDGAETNVCDHIVGTEVLFARMYGETILESRQRGL
jgi:hypothetical protein